MRTLREELKSLYLLVPIPTGVGAFSFLIIMFGYFRDCLFLKQAEATSLTGVLNMHGEKITSERAHRRDLWSLLDPTKRSGSTLVTLITVQYYHMIQIILHIPLKDLMAFSGWGVTRLKQQETRRRLGAWASEQSHSAREAALHAGSLFHRCRYHPTSGYQEPFAVLFAKITLWAYNSSLPSRILAEEGALNAEQQSHPLFRLDNKNDEDELLHWIRNGERTRPFIVGIGNIHAPGGYIKVLRLGVDLLAPLTKWRISRLFRSVSVELLVSMGRDNV